MKENKKELWFIMVVVIILMIIGMVIDEQRDDVVEIDDCEYLITRTVHGDFYEHKGNCKNSIHYSDSTVNKE